jgi:mannose-6-phosphate isomerase-like protein (cupin superfamily)
VGDLATVSEPQLPGAIGVSHLRVYDTEAPDGLRGGTPHLHTACTEAYAVVAGSGLVQTLTLDGGFAETPLEPGALVWFTPGTIHRLVNHGGLEIFVLMQNAGLPEAGDMVIAFEPSVVSDPQRYDAWAVLPEGMQTTIGPDDAARTRRDRGVEGFLRLREGGDAALQDFHAAAAALVAPKVPAWRDVLSRGPQAASALTASHLAALAAGDPRHLATASVHRRGPTEEERRYGCCGTLGTLVG